MKREYPVRLYLCGLLLAIACFSPILVLAQGVWTQKADLPSTRRHSAIGFSVGIFGYAGLGLNNVSGPTNDFWEFDPASNTWLQKATFTGSSLGVVGTAEFSTGNMGYIGTAFGPNNKDFWEYNPSTNTWNQKLDFGGTGRGSAASFSVGGKGYIGTGYESTTGNIMDLWEFDPIINSWTKMPNCPGIPRSKAIGFHIGSKGYFCGGYDGFGIAYGDLWEFDPGTNTWTQKADFGSGNAIFSGVGFSIGGIAYVGTGQDTVTTGYLNDFWAYDPTSNSWTQKPNLPAPGRVNAVGFAIGSKGYIGTGFAAQIGELKDFWEYDPNGIGIEELEEETLVAVFPNPIRESATISVEPEIPLPWNLTMVSITGQEVKNTGPVYTRSYTLERSTLPSGSYILKISYGQNRQCLKKVLLL